MRDTWELFRLVLIFCKQESGEASREKEVHANSAGLLSASLVFFVVGSATLSNPFFPAKGMEKKEVPIENHAVIVKF